MERAAGVVGTGVLLLALLGASAAAAAAGRTETVEVWGQAVGAGPAAERAAKDVARLQAIEQVAGIRIVTGGLIESGLERAHFLQSLSAGFVVAEELLEIRPDWYQKTPQDSPVAVIKVHLRVTVAVPPAATDRTFQVAATLNRSTFETGDTAALRLETKRDAWVYVFNMMADDRVSWLFPNPYQRDNHLAPGGALTVPAPGCGVCLEMQPLAGQQESAEAFLVVAFPAPQSVADVLESSRVYSLPEFYGQLLRLPLETAAIQLTPYLVRAKPSAH